MSPPPRTSPSLWQCATQPTVLSASLRVAAVVGCVLNAINQGAAILALEGISWPHVALNFIVPFCVATWSAARHEWRRPRPCD